MPRFELYPFRYRDRLTGKWVRARYVAERGEIEARYPEWEITGPPEIRETGADARYFSPWPITPHAELKRMEERPPELAPSLDDVEIFLAAVFLRRYVTYCARARRYAEMNGAARLLAALGSGRNLL